jgi:alpha-amylase/alpha-mannosidase (GH57 family)
VADRVAFLWHLHQPDYRDPERGRPILPFVRLHALRGYRDLVLETVEHGTPWTINVVPSLLDQLLEAAALVRDEVWDLTAAPLDELVARHAEAAALLPSGHPTMSRIHPRYREIRARAESGDVLEPAALRDLQVWSVLAWFGATALRDFPSLGELRAKGHGFDEDDRDEVLRVHDAILTTLPALLRRLPPGRLSCSPYFHPILPLLVDADHARRCMPGLPSTAFRHPEDALRQLVSARARTAEVCGQAPVGLWPSEGSVSPEVVALAGEAGFRWLCTDRGVLQRSVREGGGEGAWDLGHGVVGLFRDTDLSDRIGFRYAEWPADAAAADLVGAAKGRGTVLVALDGENPWESYADAGGAFRDRLRAAIDRGELPCVTVDEAASTPPVGRVRHLWTGSWIGADFRIWIGHDEDRRAWRLLADARAAAAAADEATREAAMPHLLAAEGSDWFWWFGDDFTTPFSGQFDELFRSHLRAAWRALGLPPPPALSTPVRAERPASRTEPTRVLDIDPTRAHTWLAWAGAGELRPAEGSMAVAHAVRRLQWGQDAAGRLWVRLDGRGTFDPAFEGEHLRFGEGVVSVVTGDTPLQWRTGDGDPWPAQPLSLPVAPDPALTFWGP